MDPFVVIVGGAAAGLVLALLLLGRFYPGSGAEQLDWRPTRPAEAEVQDEIDDLDQMLEATNRRRRARGKPELTEDAIALALTDDTRLAHQRRDDYVGDLELARSLDAKNQRRLHSGLPPLNLDDYRRRLEGPL